jgi:hypothetical protein
VDSEGIGPDGQPLHLKLQTRLAVKSPKDDPSLNRRQACRADDECGGRDHCGNDDEQTPDDFHW